jgi:hypothetical protein
MLGENAWRIPHRIRNHPTGERMEDQSDADLCAMAHHALAFEPGAMVARKFFVEIEEEVLAQGFPGASNKFVEYMERSGAGAAIQAGCEPGQISVLKVMLFKKEWVVTNFADPLLQLRDCLLRRAA